jgi:hypothetical protein
VPVEWRLVHTAMVSMRLPRHKVAISG